jgi:hypothetical protein
MDADFLRRRPRFARTLTSCPFMFSHLYSLILMPVLPGGAVTSRVIWRTPKCKSPSTAHLTSMADLRHSLILPGSPYLHRLREANSGSSIRHTILVGGLSITKNSHRAI